MEAFSFSLASHSATIMCFSTHLYLLNKSSSQQFLQLGEHSNIMSPV